jgi:hypothetical protein
MPTGGWKTHTKWKRTKDNIAFVAGKVVAFYAVAMKTPPEKSHGFLSDIRSFILHKPAKPTLVTFASEGEREEYTHRIMQRIGIDVAKYSVLNIHRIGVEVPVRYVFEELIHWDGESSCWPNHIATVDRLDGRLERIRILLCGWRKYPFGFKKSFFGLKFIPLFNLSAIRIQRLPGLSDDNARYLLFDSSGGYPIGIFAMYVRSSIPERGELEKTQLFFAVGFDFYGKARPPGIPIVNKIWETIHNRVTSNILNKLKQLCEWRFERLAEGRYNEKS